MKLIREAWQISKTERQCSNWCHKQCEYFDGHEGCDEEYEDCHERKMCQTKDGKIQQGDNYKVEIYRPTTGERLDWMLETPVVQLTLCKKCAKK